MDQGVRYVVRIDGINEAKSGLMSMESSASRAEASIASLNSTLAGLGIGVGLHELINFGKDAVQGAADYETAMKRIKFASADLIDAAKNQSFILGEVDKFKIPLQSATDAYGKFLAMLNGSGIAGDRIRSLHDDLLLIGKVKGLGDGQMDAAVMNLGKMLESGSLDARHFRPLEQQLSGIGAFVAKELGITVHQLAILRNKGKMTTIDPQVLLTAIEKQAASLKKFLPESTTTIQSQINDLDNSWLKFKNDLVFENITELRALFDTLKNGVAYLKEHEETIISVGKSLVFIGKLWLEYKGAMMLVNFAQRTYAGFMAGYLSKSAAVISATEGQAIAMNALALSMERVAYASELMAGASLSGVRGLGALGVPLASAGTAAGTGVVAGSVGNSIVRGTMPVVLASIAAEALAQLGGDHDSEGNYRQAWWQKLGPFSNFSGSNLKGSMLSDIQQEILKGDKYNDPKYGIGGKLYNKYHLLNETATDIFQKNAAFYEKFLPENASGIKDVSNKGIHEWLKSQGVRFPADDPDVKPNGEQMSLGDKMVRDIAAVYGKSGRDAAGKGAKETDKLKIAPPNDKVTGQRVITYNIQIDRMGTIDKVEVNNNKDFNYDDFKKRLGEALQDVLNDEQIRAGN